MRIVERHREAYRYILYAVLLGVPVGRKQYRFRVPVAGGAEYPMLTFFCSADL